jgi:hypothetical protein
MFILTKQDSIIPISLDKTDKIFIKDVGTGCFSVILSRWLDIKATGESSVNDVIETVNSRGKAVEIINKIYIGLNKNKSIISLKEEK